MQIFGQYAQGKIDDLAQNIIKTIKFNEISTEELFTRQEQILAYYRELKRIGVTLPKEDIQIHLNEPDKALELTMPYVEGLNAFDYLSVADGESSKSVIHALMAEGLKFAKSLAGDRGVGYDTALSNFIVSNTSDQVVCVDYTPPRLNFFLDQNQKAIKIPFDQLLVNYPEVATLPNNYEKNLRHFYYTSLGTVEHICCWIITACCFESAENAIELRANKRLEQILETVSEFMCKESFANLLFEECSTRLRSGELDWFLDRRIKKARAQLVEFNSALESERFSNLDQLKGS
jgi:hypothetical protein